MLWQAAKRVNSEADIRVYYTLACTVFPVNPSLLNGCGRTNGIINSIKMGFFFLFFLSFLFVFMKISQLRRCDSFSDHKNEIMNAPSVHFIRRIIRTQTKTVSCLVRSPRLLHRHGFFSSRQKEAVSLSLLHDWSQKEQPLYCRWELII